MKNENNPTTPAPEMIDIIKPEALVSISMSSGYYQRIQNALGFMIAGKSADELNEAHQQISLQNINQDWVYHYETLLILAKEFESIARKEGFVVQVTQQEAAEMLKDSL